MPDKPDVTHALAGLPVDAPPAQVSDYLTGVFESLSSPEDVSGVEHFIPGADQVYGLRVPDLRAMGKHIAQAFKKDADYCQGLARACWARPTREHRLVALFIIDSIRLSPAEYWDLGTAFLPGIQTWEDCDQLCMATLGKALRKDLARFDRLEAWIDDPDMWVRRAALVTTTRIRTNWKLDPDVLHDLDRRTLAMCDALLPDEEPYIRKAVDWAIREVLRRDYDIARDWLMAQAARTDLPAKAATTLKLSAKKLTNGASRK